MWMYLPRYLLPITNLQGWISDIPLNNWLFKGVSSAAILYSEDVFKSFPGLASSFDLPKTFFFNI